MSDDLLAATPPAVRARLSPSSATRLRQAWATARATWPAIRVAPAAYLAMLDADMLDERIAGAHLEDLYLACACAAGDNTAITTLEARWLTELPAYLGRLHPTPDELAEVRQRLRERILVAGPDGSPPRIASFTGEGPLGAWLRVAAVRIALDLRRRAPLDERASTRRELTDVAADEPALAGLKEAYRQHFRAAFADALAALAPRQRNVLRYQLLDGLSLAEIGALHGVHEATASRWAAGARDELRAATRTRLRSRLEVDAHEVDSILRLIESHLDASISRILGSDPNAKPATEAE